MILPKRMYGDPADVLQDKQAETCKGCKHREPASTGTHDYCSNTETKQLLADKRCEHYDEGE